MKRSALFSFQQALGEYASRVRAFKPNARLYLVNVLISGLAIGVFRPLFNFYVLSLGFDEALLGNLITTNNLTALVVALPVGYLPTWVASLRVTDPPGARAMNVSRTQVLGNQGMLSISEHLFWHKWLTGQINHF